jgi:hypothetical protein
MLIEAFTAGKDPARPEANEDRLVILPGRLYAVLDGVSARSPARYDGMLSGQFAAVLAQSLLERGLPRDGLAIVAALTKAIAGASTRLGLGAAPAGLRLATTMALVVDHGDEAELILVGDSGVRVDGGAIHHMTKVLDSITAALRTAAWLRATRLTDDPVVQERLSRAVVMHGTAKAEGWDDADLQAIGARAAASCAERFPEIPADLVAELLRGGIVNAQGRHQNNPDSPLGYGCLDGTAIPERFIGRLLLKAPQQIELFSDGYFAPGHGFGAASWEERFAEVEHEDPAKIARYASVKGSVGGMWSDDRTYLGIRRS